VNLYNHLMDTEKYTGKWAILSNKSVIMSDTQAVTWQYRVLDPPARVRLRYMARKPDSLVETIEVNKVHAIAQVWINCMFDVRHWSLPWWAVLEWEVVE
jgi:hypothetical protein